MPFEKNSKKVYKNTLFLYFRMILLMGVNLYTSRIVLQALGVVDFGISNVVGGIIVALSFINNSMTLAVNRYLSFEMGKETEQNTNKIFSLSVNIHVLIALFVILFGETLGLWFINHKLVIPVERMIAANWIYQFSILSFVMSVLRVPYNAMIIAHEEMKLYAYISIVEGLLKLLIAFSLLYILFDKLIIYGGLMAFSVGIITLCYIVLCKRKFKECTYHFFWNKQLFKSMTQYAGISTMGNLSSVILDQGQNILLNIFFGPVLNTARGIVYQINMALSLFVANMYMAATPQITKSYAANDRDYLVKIVNQTALFSLICLSLLIVPVIVELPYLLHLWLGDEFPKETILFGQLVLLNLFTVNLVKTLLIAIQSSAKIFKVHFYTGMLIMCNIPIDYILLKFVHVNAYSIFVVQLFIDVIFVCIVLCLAKKQLNWDIKKYIVKIIFPISLLFISDLIIMMFVTSVIVLDNILNVLLIFSLSSTYILSMSYCFLFSKKNKKVLSGRIRSFFNHYK
ncbi:Na+-driven multidrug efflux pump [Bacteroides faecichinchillae]|uniref:Na+-driven multidrug efflux pump n=3 Tax=Bacteroides faecichinchillae TaxID=871325 RepID=A0A1M5BRD1_9BACE|nr:lipopolysaccharide biosynthesis protein [Bacteroides faecichinchillae]SHF44792.1 Na+-driven multidrug efflux pump [Bacteroides faecichinchillae]